MIEEKKYTSLNRVDNCNSFRPKLSHNQLKRIILHYYYPELVGKELEERLKDRKFIVTEIENHNGTVGTIVFSIEGSPPKGLAILSVDYEDKEDYWCGNVVLHGNRRVSKIHFNVSIYKEVKERLYENL